MPIVISVEHLSKSYRLGQINTGTFTYDLQLWWAKVRGRPNPFLQIGEVDESHRDGEILWALRDVSFKVEQGEVLGIIGRNGAGKSTLLKILSRVTAPTEGKVKIKGRIASLLEVGTGFHPDLTGRENVYLNGAIMGMDRREVTRKFDEIVDFAGVEKFIDTPVKRYSSGMYVRLAFAVAAHLDPDILVVDEVLAVGDAEFQKKCLGKMGDVAKEGRTVLFVSHNMASIQNLCQRGIWLEKGMVEQDGVTDQIISRYLNTLVSSSSIDIASITDRQGAGKVRFCAVELLNNRGEVVGAVESGAEIRIRLYYDAPSGQVFRTSKFSIAVEKNGEVYFITSTELVRKDELQISGPGWIECKLCRLPLAPGSYQLTLYCKADGEIQDWVRGGVNITVDGGDFFGTGRVIPDGYHGKNVLVDHEWRS